ncbi:hypothetical protein ISCGN_023313 [Ixodes scapularis]
MRLLYHVATSGWNAALDGYADPSASYLLGPPARRTDQPQRATSPTRPRKNPGRQSRKDNPKRTNPKEDKCPLQGRTSAGAVESPWPKAWAREPIVYHQYSIMSSLDLALLDRIRQVEELCSANERLCKDNDCLPKKDEALLKEVTRLKNLYDEAEEVIDATVPPQVFTLTDVQQDSEKLAFCTGLKSLERFLASVKFVQTNYGSYKQRQQLQGRPLNLSMEDQLLLMLSHLRLGLLQQDLAYWFGVHISTLSQVWTLWVEFLAGYPYK